MSLLLITGCQSARVQDPLTTELGGNGPDQQLEFWHQLAERPVTSYDEAFHALLLFIGGEDPAKDYAGRVSELKSRGMLPRGFNAPADQAVDRGTLAVALSRAMKIKGGLVMAILGPSPRYATRELQYLSIFPPSSPNQTFSGSEFLAVMSKAEEYQKVGERPAIERPPPEMRLRTGSPGSGPAIEPAPSVEPQPKEAPAEPPSQSGSGKE